MRVLLLVLLLVSLPVAGWARTSGLGEDTAVIDGISLRVFTYRPSGCAQPSLLFVFHGSGRTAERYRNRATSLADRVCFLIYVPRFDRSRFANWKYQRGGIVSDGRVLPPSKWTVSLVTGLVEWARRREERPAAPFYLFGHSAGGQFLSRVAAFAPPPGVVRMVVANPSTHVWPSLDEPAPYGMGGVYDRAKAVARLKAYLAGPITIYLGDEDTGGRDLHDSTPAKRQGTNRLERGLNTYRFAEEMARRKGWTFNWRLVIAKGVGHTSRGMLDAPEVRDAFGFPSLD